MNFINIVDDVCSRFGLRDQDYSMTLSLSNYTNYVLSNDLGLKLMMISRAECGVSSVDINARDVGSSSYGLTSQAPCFESSSSVSMSISINLLIF